MLPGTTAQSCAKAAMGSTGMSNRRQSIAFLGFAVEDTPAAVGRSAA